MATSDAPVSVSRVVLTVRDLDRVGDFYQRAIGLDRIAGDAETLVLGQGALPLVELRRDAAARSYPAEAGLFHTAFLLPTRADLGRWLRHAAGQGLRLEGASDHLVSEALYLRDPEDNGIEIYVDRPRDQWETDGTRVRMATEPLDLNELVRVSGEWRGAPEDTVIGHVHLQVGDVTAAERFYTGPLGFDLTTSIPAASFYGTGGYHHHLATNTWRSRGAGTRSPDSAGLTEVVLTADADRALARGTSGLTDPWGNRITIEARAAA